MAMVLRIFGEVVLFIVTMSVAGTFWSCAKSPRFFYKALQDRAILQEIFNKMDWSKFDPQNDVVPSVGFGSILGIMIVSAVKATEAGRNLSALIFAVVLICSFFFGWIYLAINTGLFFLVAFMEITEAAKKNVLGDVANVLFNVRRWNALLSEECEEFCCNTRPLALKAPYQIIVASLE